ncbi:hypothetical protein EDC01DRAFT_779754 [Geopyxis carbonaria]|nr:hypothetical protein EDC01DRAFT_779754 [Geopyxis carbonaria]
MFPTLSRPPWVRSPKPGNKMDTKLVFDDNGNSSPGHYWGEDRRNDVASDRQYLSAKLFESMNSAHAMLRMYEGELVFNQAKVQEWLDGCTQFLEHLLLLFYMVGGQPLRQKDLL